MRRAMIAILLPLAGCVTVEPAPDPRGGVKPGQRVVVLVHQSPGPWIVADPDSKAETALKILPLGNFLQGMQEDRINELSKEIQPYLPRPRYDQAVETALIAALKKAHDGPVQTPAEAGIAAAQRREWNKAADQLEWRRSYFFTEPSRPSPRNYSRLLTLDDAVILDVNVSFGLEPDEQERTLPLLAAAVRAYRADTTRLLWSQEVNFTDKTSSSTLTEFRADPADLTNRLSALCVPLADRVASSFASAAELRPAPPPVVVEAPPATLMPTEPVTAASTEPVTAVSTEPVTAAPPEPAPSTAPVSP